MEATGLRETGRCQVTVVGGAARFTAVIFVVYFGLEGVRWSSGGVNSIPMNSVRFGAR